VTARYHQEVILAMELNRSHIGKLVQIITDSWSMTGALTRVDQHDNREWEIAWPSGNLVPSGGEIYAELWIGPWRGQVIGNQPVTVETVKGTLEAPETATRAVTALITDEEAAEARLAVRKGYYPEGMGEDPPAIEGTVVEPGAVHRMDDYTPSVTRCGLAHGGILAVTWVDADATCPDCLAIQAEWDADDLPPEPPVAWVKR